MPAAILPAVIPPAPNPIALTVAMHTNGTEPPTIALLPATAIALFEGLNEDDGASFNSFSGSSIIIVVKEKITHW
jgi:hypothetical protein